MNKNCYRIVFNKNRGQMMAVAEIASGQGKAAASDTTLPGGATDGETGGVAFAAKSLQTLRPVFAAVLASLGLVMFTAGVTIGSNAHAQIIADPSAPSNQRPTVLSSGNGVPLVNIQTPSAAGVSRNTYSQFDVNGQGVILNNSRTNVQTQLGGFVQGNPWLARGSARVILNEVNSSAPSQLRGYIEVGGQRAEVIIANPAGVAIDGAGFINASRVTITTGSPIVNGGNLEGYLVQRGDVTVNGRGLDTSTADYTAILARAVQVNGGIWAKELNVITGANQIAAPAGGSASVAGKLAGSGAQPMYALDVSELGGMYAGKILLIGTESGVGVRNAGSIGASAGQVRVSVDGMLTNIGSITAAGNVQLQTFGSTGGSTGLVANGITNTGTIYAQADTTLDAQGNISNAGFIAAKGNTALQATGAGAAVTSGAGSVLAAGLNADGSVSNSGNLNIAASGVSLNGRTAAGANLTVSAEQISLSQSNVSANDLSLTAAQTVDASQANVSATGVLAVNAGQTVRADGAAVSANRLQINVNSLSNVGGQLIQTGAGNTAINVQGTLDNTRGRIASNGDSVALSAQTLLNETGKLEHAGAGSLTITAQTLNSQNGQITGNGALVVSAGNVDHRLASTQANSVTINAVNFDNQGGDITQFGNGTTTINASNALDNRSGVIASNGNTRISAASLANQDGAVRANGVANLDLAVTGVLNNDAGTVSTAGNLTVVTGRLSNEVGSITANGSLNASSTQGFNNTRGLVAATQNLTVSAADLNNTRGSLASVRANASITTTGRTLNSSGNVQAEGSVTLTASGVDNSSAVGQTRGGTIAGQSIAIDTTAQQFNNQLGTVVGTQGVSITSGALNNSAGLIQAGTAAVIDTNGQGLTNTNAAGYGSSVPGSAGGIVSAGTLVLASGALDNAGGYIGAVGAMSGATAQLTNRAGGEIASSSNIDWVATGINNQQGSIQANGNINLNAQTGTLNNQAGLLLSNSALGTVTLAAAAVVNSNTRSANRGIAATNVVVTSAAVDNTDGAIVADNNLTVTAAGTVNNTNGLVSAGNALLIEDTANTRALAIDNTAGTLIAGQSNTLRARNLTGGGKVQSQNDVSIDLTGNFSNGAGAEVVARRNLSVAVGGNLVNQGQLQAGQILTVAASNVDNTATGDMLGNTTRVTVVNTLTNRGIIDGVTTEINATTLNNIGTGRIYGDQLSIAATAVNNTSEVTGGVTQAGTIAARDTLNIGAQYVNNSDGALIFSAGNLSIGGALDSNRNAIGRAADIQNTGATIEALGNVDITTARLGNNNTALAYVLSTGSNGQKTDYRTGAGTWYSDADVAWVGFAQSAADEPSTSGFSFGPDFRVNINFYVPVTAPRYTNPIFGTYFNGPRAIREAYEVCSGGYDSQTCTTFPMLLSYDKNSTIWADLGVTAPTVDIPGPKPSATVCDSSQDQTVCSPRPQKELDDWEAAATPWRLLQTRLTSFVAEMRPPAGEYDRQITSDYRTYTETTTTPVVTSTKPARILSGGDLVIDASQSAVNQDSRIIAGRTLTIRGATVDNRELQINAPTVRNGVVSIYGQVDEDCDFFGDCEPIYGYRRSAYYQEFPRTVRLNTVSYQQNTVPGPSNASALQLAAAAAASAVGPTAAAALGNAVVNGGNANITPVSAVTSAPLVTGGLGAVRSMAVPQPLPSSLFRNNPSATGNYLIETDPRFANYGKWLSSDYMLGQLGIDPASIQKRLGDGFYEQRLVNEQIAQLTGQRYLANYTSQDQQYRALMDNAVTYAKQFNVRPGIALSAAQMAQLTSDIVWLVEQTVTLPDGRTAQALVPRVYVHVQPGDIDGNGSLLAGHQVNINLTGDINNTGTIAGRDVVRLSGQNVTNLGGRINANAVGIKANVDVNNIGGAITAGSQLVVTAGRDINITTQTSSATNRAGVGVFSATTIDRVAGLYVTGNAQGQGTLIASAGRDMNLTAAIVANNAPAGQTVLDAGRNLTLISVNTSEDMNLTWDPRNYARMGQGTDVGSQVQSPGSITLQAGNNITTRAANVGAKQDLTLNAGGNVNITAGQSSKYDNRASYTEGSSLFSSSSTEIRTTSASTQAVASNLGGNTVSIKSGQDITVNASNVIADQDLSLRAGNNLSITAGTNTASSSSFKETKSSGFSLTDNGFFIGSKQDSKDEQGRSTTAAASTVGSIKGNVTLTAGQTYTQVGSDVMAPAGDITISAKNVQIIEARETSQTSTEIKSKQTGLTVAVSSGALSMIQGVESMGNAISEVGKSKDGRLQALGAASLGLQGLSAYNALTDTAGKFDPAKAFDITISASLGTNKSQSNSASTSNTARGSTVNAGNNVTITATGDGQDSNILIQGSSIKAGNNASLTADNQINLLAAKNESTDKTTNSSSSGSIGVSLSVQGLSATASASKGKGKSDGQGTSYTNARVGAGNAVVIQSGGDTNIKGAVVAANQIKADIGGNLTIESLQDTNTYNSSQKSSGFSVSVPITGGDFGASVSASKSKIDSNFQSVNEQSGLKAGDGGFQVSVANNTNLTGGVIASAQAAVDGKANTFTTGGALTITDVQNTAS